MLLFHVGGDLMPTPTSRSAPACGPRCTNGTAQLGLAGRKYYRLLSPCLLLSVFTLSSTAPPCINSLFRILLMSVPGTTSRAPLMNNGGGTGSLLPPRHGLCGYLPLQGVWFPLFLRFLLLCFLILRCCRAQGFHRHWSLGLPGCRYSA